MEFIIAGAKTELLQPFVEQIRPKAGFTIQGHRTYRDFLKNARMDSLYVDVVALDMGHGIAVPPTPGRATVIDTPQHLVSKGYPKYLISGFTQVPEQGRDLCDGFPVLLSAVKAAVDDFNDGTSSARINTVGIWEEDIGVVTSGTKAIWTNQSRLPNSAN
jgi:hypothetical protein